MTAKMSAPEVKMPLPEPGVEVPLREPVVEVPLLNAVAGDEAHMSLPPKKKKRRKNKDKTVAPNAVAGDEGHMSLPPKKKKKDVPTDPQASTQAEPVVPPERVEPVVHPEPLAKTKVECSVPRAAGFLLSAVKAPSLIKPVAKATSGAEAVAEATEERRKQWMKYLRTRQPDSRTTAQSKARTPKAGAPEKLPDNMKAKVDKNPNFYFDLWQQCGCSWGNVQMHEERLAAQSTETDQLYEHMFGFELKRDFPQPIAEGWINAMWGNEAFCTPDPFLPDDRDAARFNILKTWTARHKKNDTRTQRISIDADVNETGPTGQSAACSFMRDNDAFQVPIVFDEDDDANAGRTPEEIAEVEQRKKQEKEKREAKKNTPEEKCARWLLCLPKDIKLCKEKMTEVDGNVNVPADKKAELLGSLTKHLSSLTSARDHLENMQASKTFKEAQLKDATAEVLSLRATVASCKTTLKIYDPEEAKKKGKSASM